MRLRRPTLLVFGFFVIVVALVAARMGSDNNSDLRSYHLYNGFAALNGKFGYDLLPGGLQTFFPPNTDIIFYALVRALDAHPALLNAVLSLPTGIGAFLAFCIAMQFLPRTAGGVILAVLAVGIGVTGAAGYPTIATSATEMVSGCLLLGGLLLLVAHAEAPMPPIPTLLAAGALFGLAAGFKLTTAMYGAGAAAALFIGPPGGVWPRLRRIVPFGLAATAGALAIGGWWWLRLYRDYGNPVFPLLNNVFRSPLYYPSALIDARFLPRDWTQTLFYPFFWAFQRSHATAELDVRDPRFALAYLAVAAAVVMLVLRPDPDANRRCRVRFLLSFCVVSYILWLKQFSILRYLAPLEMLTGLVMLLPFLPLLDRFAARVAFPLAAAAAFAVLQMVTIRPGWGRVRMGHWAVSVQLPDLPPDSLVIQLNSFPMSYVAAFAPPTVRFVGARNDTIHPGGPTGLEHRVEAAIRTHAGPIWGMEGQPDKPADADATLAYYGLRRTTDCADIKSNLDVDHLRICRLAPAGGP
jgi:hypothetical protein